jgi:hypothetical protein
MDQIQETTHSLFTADIVKTLSQQSVRSIEDFLKSEDWILTGMCNGLLKISDIQTIKHDLKLKRGLHPNILAIINETQPLKSGIPSFDRLLGGGLLPGQLYEFCGDLSAGKTQICNTIALNAAINWSMNVVYVCTKGDFTILRLWNVLVAKGLPGDVSIGERERTKKIFVQCISICFRLPKVR